MEISYTEEQQALKSELRAYYENLLTPELEQELSQAAGIGPMVRKVVKQMGSRRVARHRVAQGVGRPGPLGHRAVHLLRRVDAQRCAGAHVDDQHRRPDHHEVRHQAQKEFFLPKILAGEIHFCIGYTEANSGTDLASLSHAGRTRWRGVRHQRGQDVHQPGR